MSVVTPARPPATAPPERGRRPWGGIIGRLFAAVLCLGFVLALHRIFVASGPGQRLDNSAAESTTGHTLSGGLGDVFLSGVSLPILLGGVLLAVVIALVRRRPVEAVGVLVLMAGANLTTQVLKHALLDRPDLGVTLDLANSFPSGHTTAAAGIAAVFVLVTAARWRPLVLLIGGVSAGLAGWATLTNGWHRPSDVVAAFGVVAAWYFFIRALLMLGHREGRTDAGV